MEWFKMSKEAIHRSKFLLPVAALLAVILSSVVESLSADQESPVKIIVNRAVEINELHRDDLARIYLGKKTLWDSGARIQPCLLTEKSPVTREFLESDLRKTVRQFRAYWKRRLFSGGGAAPRTFQTSAQVLDFVVSNEGGIGVVEAFVVDDRVRVLDIK